MNKFGKSCGTKWETTRLHIVFLLSRSSNILVVVDTHHARAHTIIITHGIILNTHAGISARATADNLQLARVAANVTQTAQQLAHEITL